GFAVLVIGIPFFLLFLSSIRALSLLEGRIVEATLGERMPQRHRYVRGEGSWGTRIKRWLGDRTTWTSLLYMVSMLPLGIAYFTAVVVLGSVTVALVAAPFVAPFTDARVVIAAGNADLAFAEWATIPLALASLVVALLGLHVLRGVGRFHGRYAKLMLVGS